MHSKLLSAVSPALPAESKERLSGFFKLFHPELRADTGIVQVYYPDNLLDKDKYMKYNCAKLIKKLQNVCAQKILAERQRD